MNKERNAEIIRLLTFLTDHGELHWSSQWNNRDYCRMGVYGIEVVRSIGSKDVTEITVNVDETLMLRIVLESSVPQIRELRDKIRESVTTRRIPGFLQALRSLAGEIPK